MDRFLKRAQRAFHKGPIWHYEEPREEECYTEIVSTITRWYAEDMPYTMWKMQMRET